MSSDLKEKLLAYWPLDGNFTDMASKYFNGTNHNAVLTSQNCRLGKCYYFDGSGDYIDVGASSALNLRNGYTFVVWAKHPALSQTGSMIERRINAEATSTYDFGIYHGGTSGDWNKLHNYNSDETRGGTATIEGNATWQMLSMTFNASNKADYWINDTKVYSEAGAIGTDLGSTNTMISSDYSGSEFKGYMDNIMIFDSVLSNTEIGYIYANPDFFYDESESDVTAPGLINYDSYDASVSEVRLHFAYNATVNNLTLDFNISGGNAYRNIYSGAGRSSFELYLNNLAENTTYNVGVTACDDVGNCKNYQGMSFKTSESYQYVQGSWSGYTNVVNTTNCGSYCNMRQRANIVWRSELFNKTFLFFGGATGTTDTKYVMCTESSDLVTWSTPKMIANLGVNAFHGGGALILDDEGYYRLYFDILSPTWKSVMARASFNGLDPCNSTWDFGTLYSIFDYSKCQYYGSYHVAINPQIHRNGTGYYGMFSCYTGADDSSGVHIEFASSADGYTWSNGKKILNSSVSGLWYTMNSPSCLETRKGHWQCEAFGRNSSVSPYYFWYMSMNEYPVNEPAFTTASQSLKPDSNLPFDDWLIESPALIKVGSYVYMFHGEAPDSDHRGIWYVKTPTYSGDYDLVPPHIDSYSVTALSPSGFTVRIVFNESVVNASLWVYQGGGWYRHIIDGNSTTYDFSETGKTFNTTYYYYGGGCDQSNNCVVDSCSLGVCRNVKTIINNLVDYDLISFYQGVDSICMYVNQTWNYSCRYLGVSVTKNESGWDTVYLEVNDTEASIEVCGLDTGEHIYYSLDCGEAVGVWTTNCGLYDCPQAIVPYVGWIPFSVSVPGIVFFNRTKGYVDVPITWNITNAYDRQLVYNVTKSISVDMLYQTHVEDFGSAAGVPNLDFFGSDYFIDTSLCNPHHRFDFPWFQDMDIVRDAYSWNWLVWSSGCSLFGLKNMYDVANESEISLFFYVESNMYQSGLASIGFYGSRNNESIISAILDINNPYNLSLAVNGSSVRTFQNGVKVSIKYMGNQTRLRFYANASNYYDLFSPLKYSYLSIATQKNVNDAMIDFKIQAIGFIESWQAQDVGWTASKPLYIRYDEYLQDACFRAYLSDVYNMNITGNYRDVCFTMEYREDVGNVEGNPFRLGIGSALTIIDALGGRTLIDGVYWMYILVVIAIIGFTTGSMTAGMKVASISGIFFCLVNIFSVVFIFPSVILLAIGFSKELVEWI